MRSIRFERVYKSFNGEPIIQNLNLEIPNGTFFALLGPSGSGKTTMLRMIAGFEHPDKGRIYIGDEDITDFPPDKRRVNTVFQNYALFPHLNVFDNVAYGPRLHGMHPDIVTEKVMLTLEKVRLARFSKKSIGQLSGGQQQRVALARAIINEPDVLLLDEPLAALDLKLREQMLLELVELQDELRTTFVYVTHDQFEALTVADYMAIVDEDGNVEQVGTPKEIYEYPVTTFVANFVGTSNLLQGVIKKEEEILFLAVEELGLLEVIPPQDDSWVIDGYTAYMSVRPEKIEIKKYPVDGFSNRLQGTVISIVYHGRSTQYNIRVSKNHILQVFEQNEEHSAREGITYDDTVYLHWQKDSVVLLKE